MTYRETHDVTAQNASRLTGRDNVRMKAKRVRHRKKAFRGKPYKDTVRETGVVLPKVKTYIPAYFNTNNLETTFLRRSGVRGNYTLRYTGEGFYTEKASKKTSKTTDNDDTSVQELNIYTGKDKEPEVRQSPVPRMMTRQQARRAREYDYSNEPIREEATRQAEAILNANSNAAASTSGATVRGVNDQNA